MRMEQPLAAEVDDAAKKGDIAGIKQLQQRDTSGTLSSWALKSSVRHNLTQHQSGKSLDYHHYQQSCLSRHTIAFGVEEHIWSRWVFQSSWMTLKNNQLKIKEVNKVRSRGLYHAVTSLKAFITIWYLIISGDWSFIRIHRTERHEHAQRLHNHIKGLLHAKK